MFTRLRLPRALFSLSRHKIDNIPMLDTFMAQQPVQVDTRVETPVPTEESFHLGHLKKKFRIETYGCQMNESDSQIVMAIMLQSGLGYAESLEEADIVLVNTCAIRENAEQKVITRLNQFQQWKKKKQLSSNQLRKAIKAEPGSRGRLEQEQVEGKRVVGVLGCMAERLKEKLLDKTKIVDLIVGPDSYRDLPKLVSALLSGDTLQMNTQLSLEETYSEIAPVRVDPSAISSYISIMRGCNNMCSYCIVPFVRGRERSRDVASILQEVTTLKEQGIKEITFLGQNVNSYHYSEEETRPPQETGHQNSEGFGEMYRLRRGDGVRFEHLLEQAALLAPEVRFRFTSPHPKDFPPRVLQVIRSHNNICNHIHMPAQSGNSEVLASMRRQYSREVYLNLVSSIRGVFGKYIALSSDFIVGFCGEEEEQFMDTVSLLQTVQFDLAYLFAYSSRDKTHAHRRLIDSVTDKDKQNRLARLIETYESGLKVRQQQEIGRVHLVLLDGKSRKGHYQGRSDTFKRVVMQSQHCRGDSSLGPLLRQYRDKEIESSALLDQVGCLSPGESLSTGDFVVTYIRDSNSRTLFGVPLFQSSIESFSELSLNHPFF